MPALLIGGPLRFDCFVSTSTGKKTASKFASKSMFVVMSHSGCSISFASRYPTEDEVVLPPGNFTVVSRASSTVQSVLRLQYKLYTVREVGFLPTPRDVYLAVRATHPIFEDFEKTFQMSCWREQPGGRMHRLDDMVREFVAAPFPPGQHILLLGGGGSGKTAAGVRILQLLTTAVSGAKVVPIFLPLPLLQGALPTPSGIDGFMAAQLGITNTTLVDVCHEYRVVVIMGSLDEVRDPEDALTGFLSRNPALATCGVVLTCRSHTVRDASRLFSPAAVRTMDACPMEDIEKWLRAVRDGHGHRGFKIG